MTKCVDKNEFDLVNYLQTKYFIDTLRELNMIPKQFIFISTLSVFGPVRERTYDPIMESDPPSPNTAYGLSKLKTELYLQSIPGFPYVIYRPTGVYGPREKDYYLMAKSIRQHTDFFCRLLPPGLDVCICKGYRASRLPRDREAGVPPRLFPG